MGQTQSGSQFPEESYYQSLVFNAQIQDPRYGVINVYSSPKTSDKIFSHTKLLSNESEKLSLVSLYQARLNMQNPNLLRFFGQKESSEGNVCGGIYKITAFFEHLHLDLEKELSHRESMNLKNFFSESEMLYLLRSLISVCAFLEENRLIHTDLIPTNIHVTDSGGIKISEASITNDGYTGFAKVSARKGKSYLSPLLMNALRNRSFAPEHNIYKDDVFCLGITLLRACTLTNIGAVQNWDNFTLNMQLVRNTIASAAQKQSNAIIQILGLMLTEEEVARPTFRDLLAMVPVQTSPQILNLNQKSVIRTPPQTAPVLNPPPLKESIVSPLQYSPQSRTIKPELIIPSSQPGLASTIVQTPESRRILDQQLAKGMGIPVLSAPPGFPIAPSSLPPPIMQPSLIGPNPTPLVQPNMMRPIPPNLIPPLQNIQKTAVPPPIPPIYNPPIPQFRPQLPPIITPQIPPFVQPPGFASQIAPSPRIPTQLLPPNIAPPLIAPLPPPNRGPPGMIPPQILSQPNLPIPKGSPLVGSSKIITQQQPGYEQKTSPKAQEPIKFEDKIKDALRRSEEAIAKYGNKTKE